MSHGTYAVCPYWVSEYRARVICEGMNDQCDTSVAFRTKKLAKEWKDIYCSCFGYKYCPYYQAISLIKYQEDERVNQGERDKYLLEAQKRIIAARDADVEKLAAQLQASCLWVAYLADQLIGTGQSLDVPKDLLSKADEHKILFEDGDGVVRLHRVKEAVEEKEGKQIEEAKE